MGTATLKWEFTCWLLLTWLNILLNEQYKQQNKRTVKANYNHWNFFFLSNIYFPQCLLSFHPFFMCFHCPTYYISHNNPFRSMLSLFTQPNSLDALEGAFVAEAIFPFLFPVADSGPVFSEAPGPASFGSVKLFDVSLPF